LSALGKVTVGSVLLAAVMLVYFQTLVLHSYESQLTTFMVIELVAAALMAGFPIGRWRWTPSIFVLLAFVMISADFKLIVYDLTHPGALPVFSYIVVAMTNALVGTITSIAATVQNYRRAPAERRAPRWLPLLLFGAATLCLGAILTAAIPQESGVGVGQATLSSLPALGARNIAFTQNELHVKAGETVAFRLENGDNVEHTFDIDELAVHAVLPVGKPGLALFTAATPGTYTFYCIPHYNKATGEGMRGTLIVEP
jgi:plastocyanin